MKKVLQKYIPKHAASALILHVVAVTLLVPYVWSHIGIRTHQDFILANAFVVLFIVAFFSVWELDFKKNRVQVCILGVLLLVYNGFAAYINYNYHHIYTEQVNVTIAFMFFWVLLLAKNSYELIDGKVIKACIHLMVISNVLFLLYRGITKYNSLLFLNDQIMRRSSAQGKASSWLYLHKSEYSLLLVLCVAFFVVYRKLFRNFLTYVLGQAVLLLALYKSDTQAAIIAVLLIFAGQFLDYLCTAKWWQKIVFCVGGAVSLVYVSNALIQHIKENRNTATLNGRISIWPAALEWIKENPNGIGERFAIENFVVTGTWTVNNCHNVFLNHMFRFSIPVGVIFTLMWFVIMIFCIKRSFSFMTLGMWAAILICMCMDQALYPSEMPFALFVIYCVMRDGPSLIRKKEKNNRCEFL